MAPGTVTQYETAAAEFMATALRQNWDCSTQPAADKALEKYFNVLFFNGELSNAGSLTLCGFCWVKRWSTKEGWPLARQALKGWRRAAPQAGRDPVPWEVVLVLAADLLKQSSAGALAAAALLLGFDCYLRPSETLRLTKDAVFPPRRARGPYARWAVAPHPAPGLIPSKTGAFDDTIIVGSVNPARACVPKILEALFKRPTQALFEGLDLPAYEKIVKKAAEARGLHALKMCPHLCRHGGPSTDVLEKHADLPLVQQRGRWSCPEGVMRYEKHAKLLRVIGKVPDSIFAEAHALAANQGAILVRDLVSALQQ